MKMPQFQKKTYVKIAALLVIFGASAPWAGFTLALAICAGAGVLYIIFKPYMKLFAALGVFGIFMELAMLTHGPVHPQPPAKPQHTAAHMHHVAHHHRVHISTEGA